MARAAGTSGSTLPVDAPLLQRRPVPPRRSTLHRSPTSDAAMRSPKTKLTLRPVGLPGPTPIMAWGALIAHAITPRQPERQPEPGARRDGAQRRSSPARLAAAARPQERRRRGWGSTRARTGQAAKTTPGPAARSPPLLTNSIHEIADVALLPLRLLLGLSLSLSLALAPARGRPRCARGSWSASVANARGRRFCCRPPLPVPPPRLGVVGTSAACWPPDGPGAGGDFYDCPLLADGRVAVILGASQDTVARRAGHCARALHPARQPRGGLSPRVAVQTAESVLERQLGGRSPPWWWPPTTRTSAPWCTAAPATRRRW